MFFLELTFRSCNFLISNALYFTKHFIAQNGNVQPFPYPLNIKCFIYTRGLIFCTQIIIKKYFDILYTHNLSKTNLNILRNSNVSIFFVKNTKHAYGLYLEINFMWHLQERNILQKSKLTFLSFYGNQLFDKINVQGMSILY